MATQSTWGQRAGAFLFAAVLAATGPGVAYAEDTDATPEPSVSATPTATPSAPTPSATPTVEPEASPEPTPTAEEATEEAVEPAPSPSSEVVAEPTPAPAPEPTPDASSDASPEPTAQPTEPTPETEPEATLEAEATVSRMSTARMALPAGEPVTPPSVTFTHDSEAVIGADAWVSGTISVPGAQVHSQVILNGAWVTSRIVDADATGAYRIPLSYGSTTPGTYTYRVVGVTDRGLAVSDSFTVRRTPWYVGSAGEKMIGHDTFTWSTNPGIAGKPAWTEVLVGGRWLVSQRTTASDAGAVTLQLTYGRTAPGSYVFRVRANSNYGVVTSPAFTFDRTPWAVGSAGEKYLGQQTFTWGSQSGAAGRQAWTQVNVNGRWLRSQLVTTNSAGGFTIPLTYGLTTLGDHQFRVQVNSSHGLLTSQPFILKRTIPTSQLPAVGRISSQYGMRRHPITGVYKLHDGRDIAAPCGTPVRAWDDGVVVGAVYNAAYGYWVKVDHGDGFVTGYAHMPGLSVITGQRVVRGQVIGAIGTTGLSTGCHLHWMAWQDGETFNPASLY